MRKILMPLLAVVYVLATLIMSIMSFITIDELRRENTGLKNQIVSLQASLSQASALVSGTQTVLVDLDQSYCNLIIDHWESNQENLNITTAYVQAVVVCDAPSASVEKARLVLKLNGEELSTIELTLSPGESKETLEADVKNVSFSIPELSTQDELELWLEVTLPGNLTISSYGASWYQEGGMLHLISG